MHSNDLSKVRRTLWRAADGLRANSTLSPSEALDTAMRLMEAHNPELKAVLPRGYKRLQKTTLTEMLRLFAPLPQDPDRRRLRADLRGLPVKLRQDRGTTGRRVLYAVLDGPPDRGGHRAVPRQGGRPRLRVGRHVRAVRQIRERHQGSATRELTVYGQEQKEVTVPLAQMDLALHGLSGDIRLGNSYYEDLHHAVGRFDSVMANPPFNVNGVDKDKLAGDLRFSTGCLTGCVPICGRARAVRLPDLPMTGQRFRLRPTP